MASHEETHQSTPASPEPLRKKINTVSEKPVVHFLDAVIGEGRSDVGALLKYHL